MTTVTCPSSRRAGRLCGMFLTCALTAAAGSAARAQQPAQPAEQPATAAPDAQPAQNPASGVQSQPPAATDAGASQAAAPATEGQSAPGSAAAPAETPAATAPAALSGKPGSDSDASKKEEDNDKSKAGAITEEELRHMLVGKSLYLRGGYLDNSLTFGENGKLISHSPQGSYTLCGIEIDKVHLSKHKVELEGARYGLHFLGALPYEDPTKAVDRVKITPKKKFVKITIDRELVVTPKKKKQKERQKDQIEASGKDARQKIGPGGLVMPATEDAAPAPTPSHAENSTAAEPSDEEQAKAEMAAAPKEEQPADPGSITTTTSPAHAAKVLKDALDKIFATGLDDTLMSAMPDFWKLYYQAAAAGTDYKPKDAAVLRQSVVEQKAKLLSTFQPESNDFAQDAGVAGMALYHTVVGADGKPQEIAVARPIGFGLDENAVAAIRKASFQPAMKDGHPVPVMLDLVVQFHIYSKRTNVVSKPEDASNTKEPILPGPYSVRLQQASATQ